MNPHPLATASLQFDGALDPGTIVLRVCHQFNETSCCHLQVGILAAGLDTRLERVVPEMQFSGDTVDAMLAREFDGTGPECLRDTCPWWMRFAPALKLASDIIQDGRQGGYVGHRRDPPKGPDDIKLGQLNARIVAESSRAFTKR
jgi:hypothetical protein